MNIKSFLNLRSANLVLPGMFDAMRATNRSNTRLVRARAHSLAMQLVAHAGALLAIVMVGLFLAASPQTASAQGKTILIFAPHPDDEALCCSSVISAAKASGNIVKVIVVTNGDDFTSPASASLGYMREAETVDAMSLLGLNESDVIFLGYGDQDLQALWQSSSSNSVFTSPAGQNQTYANRGLGHVDYHTFLNGSPAPYSQASILADFEAVIQNFQPDEIYTTGLIDVHPDHSGTFDFLTKALILLESQGLAKIPRVHEMTVHDPCDSCNPSYQWPNPAFTPGQPFPLPPFLTSLTQYQWNQIESIPVVPSMQDPSSSTNLKERTIAQYPSQENGDPNNWLFSFVKKNEFFWIRNFPTNMAPLATVSVSSETPASGQLGIKAVDQRIGGNPYPNATDAEWATNGELAGAWIKLTWPNPVTISQIVLYDRPNSSDNVLSGTLSFSDGSTIPVGALPPNGDPALTSFAAKTVTWVQFTVNTAQGANIGLSEFEVFGKLATSTTNHAPQLYQGPVADSETITDAQTTNVSATAFDVDGDALTYTWTTDSGTISGSGSSVVFNPPAVSAPTVVTITLTVSDGRGGSIQSSEFVTVNPSGSTGISASSLVLNPTSITSSSSSTATVTLNSAPPAGAVLTLSSSNTSAATVPATLTIPPSSLTGNFTVNSGFVNSSTAVTISASLGTPAIATLTVTPPAVALASFSVNPPTVGGGSTSTGTVTLTAPALAGGTVVNLSSGVPLVASVPANVTVPAGSTSTTFPIATSSVTDPISVNLTASLGGATFQATLRVGVYVPPNLATLASVTVSSETTASQQLGIKAIDGVVDGFTVPPGDATKEWVSNGELAGAWLRLTWSNPVTVTSVVLYDRINLVDNVTSGTLSFSDGSTVPVGTLPNAGNGLTVSFSSRTVTWVQFTVNTAAGQNIGLAEIAAYGPLLYSVTLNPSTMTGGASSTGTVTLSGPAPAGGTAVALSATNPLAQPHTIQSVHYSGALQADASIPWASLGPPFYATVPSGVVATVSGVSGLTATISNNAQQPLSYNVECPGDNCVWYGSFNPGASLLWDSGTYQPDGSWLGNGPMTVTFSSPQRGLGFQIMPDEYGPFTATMCAYDSSNVKIGCSSFSGNGTDTPADFIGIYDDTQEISKVIIDAGGALYPHDFAVGDAFVVNGQKQLATVPATVTVPAGATTATFPVTTQQVSSPMSLTISASVDTTQTATLTLTPPVLSSILMNLNSVPAGTSSTGTVTLASPAPDGGAVVTLTSDVPVAQPHTIQATTFPTALQPNGSVTPATLQPDGVINWLTLGPAYFTNIASGTVVPVSGLPGLNVTLTNSANQPLQYDLQCPGPNCVWYGNFNPGADLLWDGGTYQPDGSWLGNGPMTVTFSSPQRGLGFQIMPDEYGPFTATMCAYNSSNTQLGCASFSGAGAVLDQAIPIGIYDDTQEISKVIIDAGGALYPHDFAIGDMFVASAARPVVAVVPNSVTVPAGQTTGTFTVTTTAVNTNTLVNITGSYSGTQTTGTMQITAIAPAVSTVSFSPANVAGGNPSTGTVTLSSPAVLGGAVVTLSSDNLGVTVPVSIALPAHATSANFNVTTTAVSSPTTANITATSANTAPQTGTLTISPLAVSSLTLNPTTVQGGSANSTATVTLNGPAPIGGVTVALSSSLTSAATVPVTVTVGAGNSSAQFAVTSIAVVAQASPIITATYNSSSATATLTVNPSLHISGLSPTSGPIGTSVTITGTGFGVTGTVTFNGVVANPTNWSTTSIVAPVPTNATTGNVVVTVGGVASNGVNFTVTSVASSIAFVQVNSADPQTTPKTVAATFSKAQKAGDLNVVIIGWNDSTALVSSVADTKGNVYKLAIGPTILSGSASQSIYYASNIAAATAGANKVTVTFNVAAHFPDIRIAEYSGIDPVNPLDVAVAGQGSATTSSSGSVPTASPADLLVAGNMVHTTTTGVGTGFTSRVITNPDGDILEDRVVTVNGSYSATAPVSPAGWWIMQMAAFRATGSSGDTTPPSNPMNLVATALSATQISLGWTPSTDNNAVSQYLVERCQAVGCSTFTQIGTSTTAAYTDLGLTGNTSYSYRVRASDFSGNLSGYSNTATTTTLLTVTPQVVDLTFTRTQQFTSSSGVTWLVDGVAGGSASSGTITTTGLYTPPAIVGTHTITAQGQSASGIATVYVTNTTGVLMRDYDTYRTGLNPNETLLAPSNVNSTQFGKLFSYSIDGYADATTLYVANVNIPGQGFHNMVYVETEHDSVYGFDADGLGTNPIWKVSFINPAAGITTITPADTGDAAPSDMPVESGITGTPVIDSGSGTLYVVAVTKEVTGGNTNFVQRLHALDITTGAEKFNGPVVIQASVPGTGDGTSGGMVSFNALRENQRAALLLNNGVVYIAWAAHADKSPYHGWVLGYNASNVQQQVMAYNTTPNASDGGIWQSGDGLAMDATGRLYFVTGNGSFDANTGGVDYGDSFVTITTSGVVSDYFTPHDQATMANQDLDLGSGGTLLVPDQPGPFHLAISAGKNGTIYLVNRDNMGHYNASNDNQIVQTLVNTFPGGTFGTGNFKAPVYFNGTIYFSADADTIKAFQFNNGLLSVNPTSSTLLVPSYPGATLGISANGTTNGIVWAVQRFGVDQSGGGTVAPGVLHAYDATNLANELYNSNQAAGSRDTLDFAVKWSAPVIANGKVYVATQARLTVFGLLP